jgi:NADH:ubiquinone oxidoreductase subunit H
MTEHSASIFVFFFLGEYSSLILMSAFMSIFFLGGYHCPNIHNILLDSFIYIYYYFSYVNLSQALYLLKDVCSQIGYSVEINNDIVPYTAY